MTSVHILNGLELSVSQTQHEFDRIFDTMH